MSEKKRKVAMGGPGYSYPIRKAMGEWLTANGYEFKDFGSYEDSQPYVGHSKDVAEAVASGDFTDGVILCWSGIGPALIANKIPGIRAAVITDVEVTEACRKGNGINIITSGTKYLNPESGVEVIKAWMDNEYCLPQWTEEIQKIDDIEREYMKTENVPLYEKLIKEVVGIKE